MSGASPLSLLLPLYLVLVNLAAFLLFFADKRRAKRHAYRIPESTLLFVSAIGGAAGALIAMYLFRHKTRHRKFTILVPLFLLLQLVLVLFLARRTSIFPFL